MEAIEEFEVDIDVTDRERLYDYATCRSLHREAGGKWERDQFLAHGGTAHVQATDENMMLQVT